MNSFICLQDPTDDDSPNVLEAILSACEQATAGGASFAFASPAGISLLFKDEDFIGFVKRATFDLIVGLDSITNERSLQLLKHEADKNPKLTVHAFLNKRAVTFHPKFCWFSWSGGGAAVVGSGNLTLGGLAGNYEAFTPVSLGAPQAREVEEQWREWKARHTNEILPVDAPEVTARASKNRPKIISAPDAEEQALAVPPPSENDEEIFVAEIPRAKDRWGQANFDLDHFRSYFHLDPGTSRRVLLWHVDSVGNIEEVEVRRSVSVKSHNFRIELAAARQMEYPTLGRPIAVFRRTGARRFRYRLVMPSDSEYQVVTGLLDSHWVGPSNRVRRVTLSAADLQICWPNSPL